MCISQFENGTHTVREEEKKRRRRGDICTCDTAHKLQTGKGEEEDKKRYFYTVREEAHLL